MLDRSEHSPELAKSSIAGAPNSEPLLQRRAMQPCFQAMIPKRLSVKEYDSREAGANAAGRSIEPGHEEVVLFCGGLRERA